MVGKELNRLLLRFVVYLCLIAVLFFTFWSFWGEGVDSPYLLHSNSGDVARNFKSLYEKIEGAWRVDYSGYGYKENVVSKIEKAAKGSHIRAMSKWATDVFYYTSDKVLLAHYGLNGVTSKFYADKFVWDKGELIKVTFVPLEVESLEGGASVAEEVELRFLNKNVYYLNVRVGNAWVKVKHTRDVRGK